jgi:hypothetical protein
VPISCTTPGVIHRCLWQPSRVAQRVGSVRLLAMAVAAVSASMLLAGHAASASPQADHRPVRLTVSSSTTTVQAPGTVTFLVRAANTGHRSLHRLVLVNAVDVAGQPAGPLCKWTPSIDASCEGAMGTGYAHIPELTPGETLTWRLRVKVPLRFSGARTTNAGKDVRLYVEILAGNGAQGTAVSSPARRSVHVVNVRRDLPMTGTSLGLLLLTAAGSIASGLTMLWSSHRSTG